MDETVRERIEREAETAALFNALKHEGDAQVGAIVGPLMGENPEFREHGEEVPAVVAPVVERVNDLSGTEQRERLEELDPDLLADLEAEASTGVSADEEPDIDGRPLPDLPGVDSVEEVRMRLAPNPNGPWHLGNARMPAVVGTYKEMYDGWMLCRFDDTDPETKRPDLDAYDAILDAIDFLGFEPDEVVRASDRLETYYDYGRELVDRGGAYTCSCEGARFSDLKAAGEACPHRGKSPETTREEFQRMIDGEYDAGDMVLRVRTDIDQPNPALRDWVAFRVVDTPHPREAAAGYRCWPMLDFQSGIDDRLFDVTHIIRGIDLQDSARRQGFVYDYFGWEYPEVIHWGHVQIDEYEISLSTSTIREEVESGELEGWDDPRAPTIASLRRRGIRGAAIVEAMVELGTSTSNVNLAMSSIYAANRELVDDVADRAFLVRNGVQRDVVDGPDEGSPPVHPGHEDRGRRSIPVGGSVLVEPDDLPAEGGRVWLKGYGPVRHTDGAFVYTDDDIEVVREGDVAVIHWVPDGENVPVVLRTMDGDVRGRAEPGLAAYEVDDLVQFERVGFSRIDSGVGDTSDGGEGESDGGEGDSDSGEVVAYFAHR